ncbi:hypothetical protein BSY239_678 [Hydrogenophaga sp. RAC07]|uniref:hypothetical protein n=1 Tax=Hydrogenophaga sp. RAC07 TaxID=1842537 RepID=UPI00083E0F63|nr:hypothetical protein [Hydrogenophaga sp. RAC07]AOF86778.1 hypothetical protein BSY239_678 [Hydrogenophaga sp. RAC07]
MTNHDEIPSLTIKSLENGNLRLEDTGFSEGAIVDLHPIQVRLLAERVGLIPPPKEGEFLTLAEQARDLDRLKRNMLRVREHALQLQHGFANHADWKHADLTHDMGQINTLVDLLDMAVDDFADDYTPHEPEAPATTCKVAASQGSSAPQQPALL